MLASLTQLSTRRDAFLETSVRSVPNCIRFATRALIDNTCVALALTLPHAIYCLILSMLVCTEDSHCADNQCCMGDGTCSSKC